MKPNWNEAPAGADVCADGYWFKIEESCLLQWDDYEWVYVDYPSVYSLKDDYEVVYMRGEEPTMTAGDFLGAALGHLEDRAATYDSPEGERSMRRTVKAFTALTDIHLTEEQGFLFMEVLKQVRSLQGKFKADNYEDLAGYAALRGEAAVKARSK